MSKLFTTMKYTVIGGLAALATSVPVWADDTEVFFGESEPQNILLVLDVSGSMNDDSTEEDGQRWVYHYGYNRRHDNEQYAYYGPYGYVYRHLETDYKSKLDVMKSAFKTFINGVSDAKIGVATYSYDTNYGRIIAPIAKMDAQRRLDLIEQVEDLSASGGTPIAGALYTSMQYFQGSYKSPNGSVLPSPIEKGTCPIGNNVILLTDGAPGSTTDTNASEINTILNAQKDADGDAIGNCTRGNTSPAGGYDGKVCAQNLAKGFYNNNQVADTTSNVRVHTIGFGNESDTDATNFLKSLSETYGGGEHISAGSEDELAKAFTKIANTAVSNAGFVAPSIPISQSNRLNTDDAAYFAMFQPSPKASWLGNLKKYEFKAVQEDVVDEDGNTKTVTNYILVSSDGSPAIDDEKGTFYKDTVSGWNGIEDGNVVFRSGAANNLSEGTTFSNLKSDNLKDKANLLTVDNNELTEFEFRQIFKTTSGSVEPILEWFDDRTIEVEDPDNSDKTITVSRMGDPLHSEPAIVDYQRTADNLIRYGFVATNQGYLHAVNLVTGKEMWSFVPRDLLTKAEQWKANGSLSNQNFREYGLDGDITVYPIDGNQDGDLLDGDDKVYLFVGMRRGGSNYYVLDITNRNSPKMVFSVKGQTPLLGDYPGYTGEKSVTITDLGETWSKPIVGKIKTGGGQDKTVMLFGGGYTDYYDDLNHPVNPDSDLLESLGFSEGLKGNNIYAIDLDLDSSNNIGTPKLLFDANSDVADVTITNSIASDLSVIDLDSDKYIDRIYASDVGGKIYRIDFPSDGNLNKLSGTTVADFSDTSANRFYNKPDVSYAVSKGKFFAAISIGSGMRPNPLNVDSTDRAYVIFDKDAVTPTKTATIKESGLLNVTSKRPDPNGGTASFYNFQDIEAAGKSGWYINLDKGEKALSDSFTSNYRVFFTTYLPPSDRDDGACFGALGRNFIWGVDLLSGKPVVPSFDATPDDGHLTNVSDRRYETGYQGISPPPVQVYPGGVKGEGVIIVGGNAACVGAGCGDNGSALKTVRWKQEK